MKQTLFTIFLGTYSIICQSQSINPVITLQDGTIVDCSHAFLDNEMPTFHVQNNKGDITKWSFNLYENNNRKKEIIESERGIENFSFRITHDLFPRNLAYNYKKAEFPNDSSVYTCGSVDLYNNEKLVDSIPILLNLLPSRPKVKDISISGTFDYQMGGYSPLARLMMSFTSERMEDCSLVHFVSDSVSNFVFPKDTDIITTIYQKMDYQKIKQNFYGLEYKFADWGEFYTISAVNRYGSVHGDTIHTNDGITNPDILHFLEIMRSPTDIIDEISEDECPIIMRNGMISSLKNYAGMDFTVDIYSVNGILVYRSTSPQRIDLRHLTNGMYIIRIKSNNKSITKKIIKS